MAGTKQPELTIERFSVLVEAYGSNLERFPERERTAAKALALRSPEAQALLAAARVFDSLLASARDDLPSAPFEQELARIPERFMQQRPTRRWSPFPSHARAGWAAAAAVALGLLGGQLVGADALDNSSSSRDDAAVTSDQADLASLTFADELFSDLTVEAAYQGGAE